MNQELDAIIKDVELKASFEYEDKMKEFIKAQCSTLDMPLILAIKVGSKEDIEKSIKDLHELISKIAKDSFNFGVSIGIRNFALEVIEKYKEI